MPVTVVIGGQFGSEGKGKVAHFLAEQMNATVAVRVGGPNSGHTVIDSYRNALVFRQLPTAALLPNVYCVLPAGSYVEPDLLFKEIRKARMNTARLIIDPNAVVVTAEEMADEKGSPLQVQIGSTQSGTGAAVLRRIERLGKARMVSTEESLRPFVRPAVPFLRERLIRNQRVVIEGTQGFGLSVYHSPHYPFATSRDTTAAGFVAETGLSPVDVDDITMVIRAFPIRVSGNSGPLLYETTWSDITKDSGGSGDLVEFTSVTRQVRRVARFDADIVKRAILHNSPTRIVLNHVDYLDAKCARGRLTPKAISFVETTERLIERTIDLVGLGPGQLVSSRHASATRRIG